MPPEIESIFVGGEQTDQCTKRAVRNGHIDAIAKCLLDKSIGQCESEATVIFDSIDDKIECTSFSYNFTGVESRNDNAMTSLVSEFDLVCDRGWIVPFIISIKAVTGFVGCAIGSPMSDKYGRRVAMLVCAIGQALFAFPMAFMPNWWSFLIIDMIRHGIIQIGYLAASVYVCEVLGPSKRHWAVISSIIFAVGYAFTGLVSWALPQWHELILCLAAISTLYIPIVLFLPESPQFLWSQGELSKAEQVLQVFNGGTPLSPGLLRRVTKINPVICDNDRSEIRQSIRQMVQQKTESWSTIFSSCFFVQTLLTMSFMFLSAASVYYGLAYKAASLPGSIFINNMLNGLVDIVAYVLVALIMERVGRRTLVLVSFGLGAICSAICGVLFYLNESSTMIETARWISFICKFFISSVHGLLYVYVAEVFPTSVRSIGTGVAMFGDEIGELLAPYVLIINTVWVPYAAFGVLSVIATLMSFTLVETLNKPIPETLNEMKNLRTYTGKRKRQVATVHPTIQ